MKWAPKVVIKNGQMPITEAWLLDKGRHMALLTFTTKEKYPVILSLSPSMVMLGPYGGTYTSVTFTNLPPGWEVGHAWPDRHCLYVLLVRPKSKATLIYESN
jgi:hypothetical protein